MLKIRNIVNVATAEEIIKLRIRRSKQAHAVYTEVGAIIVEPTFGDPFIFPRIKFKEDSRNNLAFELRHDHTTKYVLTIDMKAPKELLEFQIRFGMAAIWFFEQTSTMVMDPCGFEEYDRYYRYIIIATDMLFGTSYHRTLYLLISHYDSIIKDPIGAMFHTKTHYILEDSLSRNWRNALTKSLDNLDKLLIERSEPFDETGEDFISLMHKTFQSDLFNLYAILIMKYIIDTDYGKTQKIVAEFHGDWNTSKKEKIQYILNKAYNEDNDLEISEIGSVGMVVRRYIRAVTLYGRAISEPGRNSSKRGVVKNEE